MVTALAIEPVSSGTTHLQDYRHRPAMGERTLLPNGTAQTQPGAQPRNEQRQHDRRQEASPSPPPSRSGSSMFAAAVIAGALPPTPQSMDELIRRIGSSEIPPESEARLKDILA
ncbi:hypothetical protein [Devosia faecipullorum]|uniref:hypothetical protein n=1 Tax=Devosia faecipullorum TaxID=2755039 RepID=UPI00187BA493|nr:hypothetical protein [Devosia faecipullorum]MBE7732105.1 hypothetical protein [Devosia faecipullorum]